MKRDAVVRMKFPSQRQLEVVFKALEPEAKKSPTERSKATLEKEDSYLILRIEAKDTVALRAAANAYLRWIDSMKNILEVLGKLG